jgi:hypothetical protein
MSSSMVKLDVAFARINQLAFIAYKKKCIFVTIVQETTMFNSTILNLNLSTNYKN